MRLVGPTRVCWPILQGDGVRFLTVEYLKDYKMAVNGFYNLVLIKLDLLVLTTQAWSEIVGLSN
jgi:hypothetical protein